MLLSITVLHNKTSNVVHILVQHFILYFIGNGMVFGAALFFCYFTICLVKKVIGSSAFCSSVVSLILGSILRGNSSSIMVSSYS